MSTVYVNCSFLSLSCGNKLASQTLLTQDQRNWQKNLYNSSLYLSSTWNERKVNIPNWHHQLEEIRVHPSVRTLASACSKRSANSAWHIPFIRILQEGKLFIQSILVIRTNWIHQLFAACEVSPITYWWFSQQQNKRTFFKQLLYS